MDIRELRFGSIVKGVTTDYCYIESISPWRVVGVLNGIISGFNSGPREVEPVQLTEEWLLKLGFNEDKGYFNRYGFRAKSMNSDNTSFMMTIGEQRVGKFLNHVHQLQNIYFALTGKELTHA